MKKEMIYILVQKIFIMQKIIEKCEMVITDRL